jgi:hypothetical protein
VFNKEINFYWNNKSSNVPVDLNSIANRFGGLAYEFVLPEINPNYRVFMAREQGVYFIFKNKALLSVISGSGRILSFKDKELISEKFRITGVAYTNYERGVLEVRGAFLKKIFLNGEFVGRLGSPSIFEWLITCVTSARIEKLEFWDGLRFDDSQLDLDIAITLLISKVGMFND